MALEPDAIDLDGLPRTIGGGLKREPVEELLKRVQWEYSQLYYEHKRLKEESERRGRADSGLRDEQKPAASTSVVEPQVAPAPSKPTPAAHPDDGPVARIERTLRAEPREIATAAPEPSEPAQPIPAQAIEPEPHRELDDLARLVLATAHRTSTELRESARSDCELMLKKTRERIAERERSLERAETKRAAELAELERDFEHAKARRTAELEELEELMREIRSQMQATLEVLIDEAEPESEVAEPTEPAEDNAVTTLHPAEVPAENGASDDAAPQGLGRSELEAAS